MGEDDNDGRFPDESPVEVRYPRSKQEEHANRDSWPWLAGSIIEQCRPDEWLVCAQLAPSGTAVLWLIGRNDRIRVSG